MTLMDSCWVMVVRRDTVATDLQRGVFLWRRVNRRMQRGGRVLRFRERDFNMETFIVNEDLTHEVQKPGKAQLKPQDVCNGMKPPMK